MYYVGVGCILCVYVICFCIVRIRYMPLYRVYALYAPVLECRIHSRGMSLGISLLATRNCVCVSAVDVSSVYLEVRQLGVPASVDGSSVRLKVHPLLFRPCFVSCCAFL